MSKIRHSFWPIEHRLVSKIIIAYRRISLFSEPLNRVLNLAMFMPGDRQFGELSSVSYSSELSYGELQDLEFSKS